MSCHAITEDFVIEAGDDDFDVDDDVEVIPVSELSGGFNDELSESDDDDFGESEWYAEGLMEGGQTRTRGGGGGAAGGGGGRREVAVLSRRVERPEAQLRYADAMARFAGTDVGIFATVGDGNCGFESIQIAMYEKTKTMLPYSIANIRENIARQFTDADIRDQHANYDAILTGFAFDVCDLVKLARGILPEGSSPEAHADAKMGFAFKGIPSLDASGRAGGVLHVIENRDSLIRGITHGFDIRKFTKIGHGEDIPGLATCAWINVRDAESEGEPDEIMWMDERMVAKANTVPDWGVFFIVVKPRSINVSYDTWNQDRHNSIAFLQLQGAHFDLLRYKDQSVFDAENGIPNVLRSLIERNNPGAYVLQHRQILGKFKVMAGAEARPIDSSRAEAERESILEVVRRAEEAERAVAAAIGRPVYERPVAAKRPREEELLSNVAAINAAVKQLENIKYGFMTPVASYIGPFQELMRLAPSLAGLPAIKDRLKAISSRREFMSFIFNLVPTPGNPNKVILEQIQKYKSDNGL